MHSKKIKIIKQYLVFEREWGNYYGQLHLKKSTEVNKDIIPKFFYVDENKDVVIKDQYAGNNSLKYYDCNGRLVHVEKYQCILNMYKKYNEYEFIQYQRNSDVEIILLHLKKKSKSKFIFIISFKDERVKVIENNKYNNWNKDSFYKLAHDGTFLVKHNQFVANYDQEGNLIHELKVSDNILYIDKYKNIYIKTDVARVSVYNYSDNLKKEIASINIPPEIGPDFNIDGGNINSYLYQLESESKNTDTKKTTGVLIYQLDRSFEKKWLLIFKGYLSLGGCSIKNCESETYVENYIDTNKFLIQVSDNGSIFHMQRDEEKFRILQKII